MTDQALLSRLPYHAPEGSPQIERLIQSRKALGVITQGEEGITLYPHPIPGNRNV